jgi:predicted DNA-binding helix-hairpin-helix protein
MLLRIPGLGVKAVDAILATRRWRRLRLADLARLTVSIAKLRPFMIAEDWKPVALADLADLRPLVSSKHRQLELFGA